MQIPIGYHNALITYSKIRYIAHYQYLIVECLRTAVPNLIADRLTPLSPRIVADICPPLPFNIDFS